MRPFRREDAAFAALLTDPPFRPSATACGFLRFFMKQESNCFGPESQRLGAHVRAVELLVDQILRRIDAA